jgi:hypothetical protein
MFAEAGALSFISKRDLSRRIGERKQFWIGRSLQAVRKAREERLSRTQSRRPNALRKSSVKELLNTAQIEAILANNKAVRDEQACQVLNIGPRQLRNLKKRKAIVKTPAGLISTDSIRAYLWGPKETGKDRQ